MPSPITYYRRNAYGNEHAYPTDAEFAKTHSLLTGRKTLLPSDIRAYQRLGFAFKEVVAPARKAR